MRINKIAATAIATSLSASLALGVAGPALANAHAPNRAAAVATDAPAAASSRLDAVAKLGETLSLAAILAKDAQAKSPNMDALKDQQGRVQSAADQLLASLKGATPADKPAADPAMAPADNSPAGTPATSPADMPAQPPAATPAATPADNQAETPATAPAENQSQAPAAAPSDNQAKSPADQPAMPPATAPAENPADAPAAAPSDNQAKSPADQPAMPPAMAPAENPADAPAAAPADNQAEVSAAAPSLILAPTDPANQPMVLAPADTKAADAGSDVQAQLTKLAQDIGDLLAAVAAGDATKVSAAIDNITGDLQALLLAVTDLLTGAPQQVK